jgi:hypothetical protein
MDNLIIIDSENKEINNDNIVLLSDKYYIELYQIFANFFVKIFEKKQIISDREIFSDVIGLIEKNYVNNSKILEQIFKGAGYFAFKRLKIDIADQITYKKKLDYILSVVSDKTQGTDWTPFFIIFREINKYFRNNTHVFSLGDSIDKFVSFWNISQQDPRIAEEDKKIIKRIPFSGSMYDDEAGNISINETKKNKSEELFVNFIENNDEFRHLLKLLHENQRVVIMDFGAYGRAFLTLIYLLKNLSEKDPRFNFLNSRINNLTFILFVYVDEEMTQKYVSYMEELNLVEFYNHDNLKIIDVNFLDHYHTNSDKGKILL